MKKLIQGIMEFRRIRRPHVKESFARLALGQRPDALFITCSDSRVAANVFASTHPGDLFVARNVGNMVPAWPDKGSTVAALEYALTELRVRHILVCGHSHCGAMIARTRPDPIATDTPLGLWLRHAPTPGPGETADDLSRRNVIWQLANLRTHPAVQKEEADGRLALHGLWFDIHEAEVHYLEDGRQFVPIDDDTGARLLSRWTDQ